MVREDILGGLKSAISRGDTLQRAMQSFYNAGYKKEEIEKAARALQIEEFEKQKRLVQQGQNYRKESPKNSFFSKLGFFKNKPPQEKHPWKKEQQKFPQHPSLPSIPSQVKRIKSITPKPIKPVQPVSGYEQKPQDFNVKNKDAFGIKRRNPALVFLFSLFTLGIYFIYWLVSTTNELRKNTNSAPNSKYLWFLLFPPIGIIFLIIHYWKYSKAINELTGFSKLGLMALWVFFSPAAIILSQIELNKKSPLIKKIQKSPQIRPGSLKPVHNIPQVKTIQKVSNYEQKSTKPKRDILAISLISIHHVM